MVLKKAIINKNVGLFLIIWIKITLGTFEKYGFPGPDPDSDIYIELVEVRCSHTFSKRSSSD